jgi:hypothetical protein
MLGLLQNREEMGYTGDTDVWLRKSAFDDAENLV